MENMQINGCARCWAFCSPYLTVDFKTNSAYVSVLTDAYTGKEMTSILSAPLSKVRPVHQQFLDLYLSNAERILELSPGNQIEKVTDEHLKVVKLVRSGNLDGVLELALSWGDTSPAVITETKVARAILESCQLPFEAPRQHPARLPPSVYDDSQY